MRRLIVVLSVIGIGAGGCSDNLPNEPLAPKRELLVVSGNDQVGPPGAELPNPLVVKVVDDRGRSVEDQIVNFRVVAGGGSVFAGAAITNKNGIAQERWTLGPSGSQRVEARAVDPDNGAPLTFAVFNATLVDNVPPTVTINQAAGQPDPTNAAPITFAVQFSEAVTGFTGSDVSFTGSTVGGTLEASVSGSGASYTVSVTGMTGSGIVVASIPAGAATNAGATPSLASTSTDNTVTFLATPPTVTINQAAGQPDPTDTAPITFAVQFSEVVTGFTGSDVSFTGSTVGGTLLASVSGSGASYTVSVTGMSGTGIVVASIPAGAAINAGATPSLASTSTDNTVTFLATPPTVTINQAAGQPDPTNTTPVTFAVQFSEAVTGFNAADVDLSASTLSGLVATVSGSGASYTVFVTGMTGSGTVVASIPAGAAINAGATPSLASTSTDNAVTFDPDHPTVTINQGAGQPDPTDASPITFTVQFSEAVVGFIGSDVSFTGSTVGGILLASVSGSGADYTVSVTGMTGTGIVVVSIPAGFASDLSGNANLASTSIDNTVAFLGPAPTVTIH